MGTVSLIAMSADRPLPALRWARLIAIGSAAGVLSGLLGVGGGIILVPLLVGVLAYDQHRAHATSLAAIFTIAVSGTIGFALGGAVAWRLGLVVAAGAIVGSTVGARQMGKMSPRLLRSVFLVMLVVAAIQMLTGAEVGAGEVVEGASQVAVALVIGLLSGLASAVAGVGGGIVIVPSLVFFVGMGQHAAAGTSLMVIVFTAVAATRVNWVAGRVDLRQAAVLGLAGAVSAQIGAWVALGRDPTVITRAFGVFVLVVAAQLAWSLRPGGLRQR